MFDVDVLEFFSANFDILVHILMSFVHILAILGACMHISQFLSA
jgi:hypothetical protein